MELKKGETIEWFVEDKANIIAHRPSVPPNPITVKKPSPLLTQWEALWNAAADKACSCASCRERFHAHLLAQLVCPGRHTLTLLITTGGRQFRDWTADYSLYAKQRVEPGAFFQSGSPGD